MCGIAGVIGSQRFAKADVAGMIESIAYRGRDEQNVVQIGPALLGHARLAVVDPENGGQPMSNTDDTVWVVFNGEIYNFIELREDLKAKGYRFKSRCDTEVLVHLWREKGPAMLEDLIGMFAEAGASYITFHPEASEHVDRSLQLIRDSGCKSGLVFNPATPLNHRQTLSKPSYSPSYQLHSFCAAW